MVVRPQDYGGASTFHVSYSDKMFINVKSEDITILVPTLSENMECEVETKTE